MQKKKIVKKAVSEKHTRVRNSVIYLKTDNTVDSIEKEENFVDEMVITDFEPIKQNKKNKKIKEIENNEQIEE